MHYQENEMKDAEHIIKICNLKTRLDYSNVNATKSMSADQEMKNIKELYAKLGGNFPKERM